MNIDKKLKNIGVTQKAVVWRRDGKFLAMRRSKTAPTHPLAWDLPGGELEYGEAPVAGIAREIKEETGLEVKDLRPFDVFGHENLGGFWVTIAYTCNALTDTVVLSYEHVDFQWVTKEKFLKLESTDKLRQFVSKL